MHACLCVSPLHWLANWTLIRVSHNSRNIITGTMRWTYSNFYKEVEKMVEPNDLNASHLSVFIPAMKTQRRHVQCITWLIYMQFRIHKPGWKWLKKKSYLILWLTKWSLNINRVKSTFRLHIMIFLCVSWTWNSLRVKNTGEAQYQYNLYHLYTYNVIFRQIKAKQANRSYF